MTTEETELTFVRCPSCRSLVPAVATRCRMCGYSFESGAEASAADDNAASQSKSRVRQRTISASREQLDELAAASGEAAQASEDFSVDAGSVETPSFFPPSEDDDSQPLLSDPFGSNEFEVVQREEQSDDDDDEVSQESDEDQSESDTENEPESSVMESFSAAIRFGSGASDSTPKEEEREDTGLDAQEDDSQEQGDDSDTDDSESDDDEEPQAREAQEEQTPSKRRRRRRRRRKSQVTSEEVNNNEENEEMSAKPQKSSSRASTGVGSEGVLVGWFVSFMDNPKGEAEELRSGKFFIGRQQLRDDDMVLDKEGISTPHCLVAVTSDGGLLVQDLMSENGTLVCRADEDEFESIGGETVEVEHGDKLRLGSCEFTICLLPTD